ncbi:hypothetical protein FisN_19Hh211 [Fistulifera solaris]|jgi:hypothetical protein|uniref:NmrA-like domain-containing protein n=1 Tax=Fistulifera solaris TaxID=1519565 RepID=A0A1Z5K0V2_FISSO|nr:hypothetical protein FisN_19Hh211 [Fistulifera solaris]|eukprot:GAX19631.1 hypothetical protein FisN_19Hh211 [Fistulifera solaris]
MTETSRPAVNMDQKLALNAQIVSMAFDQLSPRSQVDVVSRNIRSRANQTTTEWNVGASGGGGTFQEVWPSHLPRPPSRKRVTVDEDDDNPNAPRVVIFQATTQEGISLVRAMSDRGLKVNAVVRVTSNPKTKKLIKMKGVTVKVADLNNLEAVQMAAQGCQQAFLVTKYWGRFENPIEEGMARVVLQACSEAGVTRLVLASFEDTTELRNRGLKSQLRPTADGRIFPNFDTMASIDAQAKKVNVQLTHMFTSFLDEADKKRSLILIRGGNGKIITQSHVQALKK